MCGRNEADEKEPEDRESPCGQKVPPPAAARDAPDPRHPPPLHTSIGDLLHLEPRFKRNLMGFLALSAAWVPIPGGDLLQGGGCGQGLGY